MSPSTEAPSRNSTFSVACTLPITAPLMVMVLAVRSAFTLAPGPISRLWFPSSIEPSTLPSIVRSSLLTIRPSTRSAFPTHAATRRSEKAVMLSAGGLIGVGSGEGDGVAATGI